MDKEKESCTDHDHHSPSPESWSRPKESQALTRALGITLIFMVVELAGGWYANSLALLADAIHMLTDSGALLISYFAYRISRRPANQKLSFGYKRAEILGALINGLLIWLLCGFLIYEAIERISSPPEVKGPVVAIVATFGLFINLIVLKILHPSQSGNLNIRSAYLHVIGDVLGSVAAIIAGIVLYFTNWWIVDPLVTIIFSVFILFSSWGMIKETVGILMESTPKGVDSQDIKDTLDSIPDVESIHDLHIWCISSGYYALSAHIITKEGNSVLARAHKVLKEKYQITHTTLQIEHPEEFKSEHCFDCSY